MYAQVECNLQGGGVVGGAAGYGGAPSLGSHKPSGGRSGGGLQVLE